MRRRLFSPFRPYICHNCRSGVTRFSPLINAPRSYSKSNVPNSQVEAQKTHSERKEQVENRIKELGGITALPARYPRYEPEENIPTYSAQEYLYQYEAKIEQLAPEEWSEKSKVSIHGRLVRKRRFGSGLHFYVIGDGRHNIQCTVNLKHLKAENDDAGRKRLSEFWKNAHRGDWMVFKGFIQKTRERDLGVLVEQWPQSVSPVLRVVPETASSPDFLKRNRHVDQIINPESRNILILRHVIINTMRVFFIQRAFIEVSTPLLVQGAGGAAARPFETYATEFSGFPLNLRVAPELWLKRLIVGNLQRVFELGPVFRNEGVDHTHNPEFTICEFYQAFTPLPELMRMTEDLFTQLDAAVKQLFPDEQKGQLAHLRDINFATPFKQLPFIPTLIEQTRAKLPTWNFPDVNGAKAKDILLDAFDAHAIPRPPLSDEHSNSIPRLLDSLASHVLEPLCQHPTFITHYPECMSPLAKSFQAEYQYGTYTVSARAELFIQGREYVNCYEEENSPVEQRKKFEEQLSQRYGEGQNEAVDENYVQALEWGLPPTGGWGCGVDRIVMLFGGKSRIADVLPFGNLSNVVRLGNARQKGILSEEGTVE